jgi:hypothetical protein
MFSLQTFRWWYLHCVHVLTNPQAAKAITEGKAAVSAVGDLYALPFAEDLGLKV